MNPKNIILGAGQVSEALQPYIVNHKVFDKGEWEQLPQHEGIKCLHVCIPYSEHFTMIVWEAIKVFDPEVTVIHSTVKPGTTDSLHASYSPVLGRHENNFKRDVKKYKKLFAGSKQDFDIFKSQVKGLDLIHFTYNTDELEFAKLQSTNYMYWCLIYEKLIFKVCQERGYKFTNVYKKWNKNYNAGVKKDWQRPIYTHDDNPIPSGHCLPNNIFLDDEFISLFLREWQRNNGELHLTSFKT